MRIVKYIALAIDWVLAVAIGAAVALVWLLAGVFKHPAAAKMVADLDLNAWDNASIVCFGLGLLVLNVVVLIDLVANSWYPSYLRLNTPAGRVNVSTRAIEDALRRVVMGVDGVDAARVRVSAPAKRGRPVSVRTHITMRGGVVYHDVSRAIVSAVESRFSDIVGAGIALECHVYWEKIKAESAGPQAPETPVYDTLRPQFPVEEDDQDAT
jgi:hypothetical protein